MSDFIFYVTVAVGLCPVAISKRDSLRLSSSDGFMTISRKLRNLKVAATQIAQFRSKQVRRDFNIKGVYNQSFLKTMIIA